MKLLRILFCTVLLAFQFTPAAFAGGAHGSASFFNNGATQVNPNFVETSGQFAFVDMLKQGTDITSANQTVSPSLLDVNGYPISGTWSKFTQIPLQSQVSMARSVMRYSSYHHHHH